MGETTTQPYTLQSLFDLAWQKFVVEKQPASYDRFGCRYRGPKGERCIIGWAIPDDEYKESMEGCVASTLAEGRLRHLFGQMSADALDELQACHDNAPCPFHRAIEAELREFALGYGLVIPEAPNA